MSEASAIITMDDMAVVFSVTDDYGVHRESVSVELAKEDPGAVAVNDRGLVEITLPASRAPSEFAHAIRAELETQGYSYNPGQIVSNDADTDDDDGDDWLA